MNVGSFSSETFFGAGTQQITTAKTKLPKTTPSCPISRAALPSHLQKPPNKHSVKLLRQATFKSPLRQAAQQPLFAKPLSPAP